MLNPAEHQPGGNPAKKHQERWIWVSGWGLKPEWLAAQLASHFPEAIHTVVPPERDCIEKIDWTLYDRAGGYSLGAFLLLHPEHVPPLPTLLLAPFFSFTREAGFEGRSPLRQMRLLRTTLLRSPFRTLSEIYSLMELQLPEPTSLPYSIEDLKWGLETLSNVSLPPVLPAHFEGFIGENDAIIDAATLASRAPGIHVVSGAGHHPSSLLSAAVASL